MMIRRRMRVALYSIIAVTPVASLWRGVIPVIPVAASRRSSKHGRNGCK